ncbi:MAG: DUF192 domain-containing protein [Bdellovibrionota bacterium]
MVQVQRYKDKMVVARKCAVADSAWQRLVGLMGKRELEEGSALLLSPCNSVHTFFMKFSIDVVYLDAEFKVIAIRRAMKPWRIDFPVFGARAVLELPSQGADGLSEGDLLCIN